MLFRVILILMMTYVVSLGQQKENVTFIIKGTSGALLKDVVVINQDGQKFQSNTGTVSFYEPPGLRSFFIKSIGYITIKTQPFEITYKGKVEETFVLNEAPSLTPTGSLGSRSTNGKQLSELAAPIDVIIKKDILESPYTELSQILHYLITSFNSNRQVIADGTDHIDPLSLRGLGPDQVLILVNHKRRHSSSLVNINNTFGRGSVSTDINVIPLALIKRIEILRDGAASQYGSDAIAGVIDIILEDTDTFLEASYQNGSYNSSTLYEKYQDGKTKVFNLAFGGDFLKEKGYFSLGFMSSNRGATNRTGSDTRPLLYSNEPSKSNNESENDFVRRFSMLKVADSVLANNNGLSRKNMRVGIAEMKTWSLMSNVSYELSDNHKLYTMIGFSQKKGNAAGFYRLPRQTSQSNLTVFPNGYLPEINSRINDISNISGIKGKLLRWDYDLSNTLGSNNFRFLVDHSINASIPNDTQTSFDSGRLSFLQNTTNLDLVRKFYPRYNSDFINNIQVALGAEYRIEHYNIKAGEEKSWSSGFPHNPNYAGTQIPGAQVFPGFKPINELNEGKGEVRSNFAFYLDIENEMGSQKRTLIELASRFENYSDFGNNISYKGALRHKILDSPYSQKLTNVSIRANIASGFRAPSLHQRWFNNESTQNVAGNLLQVLTVNNNDRIVDSLGLKGLKPEISRNFGLGLVAEGPNIFISLDGYWIDVTNRIVFSSQFPTSIPTVANIINNPKISSVQFFTNAISTNSWGIDVFVKKRHNLTEIADLNFIISANINQTTVGQVSSSEFIDNNPTLKGLLFNRQEESRFESFIPKNKLLLGTAYTLKNKKQEEWLNLRWQTIRFDEVGFLEAGLRDDINSRPSDQIFSPKWVHDFSIEFRYRDVSATFGVLNLFDTYPDKQFIHPRNNPDNLASSPTSNYTGALDNTSNGRVVYSRTVTQFGANGRFLYWKLRLNINN